MLFKYGDSYQTHSEFCYSMFDGHLFLPNVLEDFEKMEKFIDYAEKLRHVYSETENSECRKFWIPLKKQGSDSELKWTQSRRNAKLNGTRGAASLLPFAIGKQVMNRFSIWHLALLLEICVISQ